VYTHETSNKKIDKQFLIKEKVLSYSLKESFSKRIDLFEKNPPNTSTLCE
jgi:hypothetical protein